jgi:hypothetical protein
MLFDVGFDRDEVLVDELGGLGVFVALGIQPSARASGGRGAEVQQDGLSLRLGVGQGLVYVLTPFHGHRLSFCGIHHKTPGRLVV